MTRSRTRFTVLVAMLSALFLAIPAWASSGVSISFSNTPDTAGDPVTTVTGVAMTVHATWMTIDMGGGIVVTPNSSSSSPSNGEQVGEVDVTTRYLHNLCLTRSYNYPIKWVSPISSGAPSGTIAEWAIDAGFVTVRAYVVEDSTGKHSIEIDMGILDGVVCSGTPPTTPMIITTYSHSSGSNSVVARNSSTTGTYTVTVTIIDTSGNSHSDTDNFDVN